MERGHSRIAGLDLTSCSASGRHCISCSICASRPPQPPLSTFMGSIPRWPSSIRGTSSSSSSSPAARRGGREGERARARGVRLTEWGRKSGRGAEPRERRERLVGKAACQVGLPAPHMGPLAPRRVRCGKWLGNDYASVADRLVGVWVRAVSGSEHCGRQATWSENRKRKRSLTAHRDPSVRPFWRVELGWVTGSMVPACKGPIFQSHPVPGGLR